LPMLRGSDFMHPSLWVRSRVGDQSISDSLLEYNSVLDNYHAWSQMYKMAFLWASCDTAQSYILGSSRHSWGIQPSAFTVLHPINVAMAGHTAVDAFRLLNHYILPNCSSVKYLVIGVDIDLFAEVYAGWFATNFEASKGYQFDVNHKFWVGQRDNAFVTAACAKIPPAVSPFPLIINDGSEWPVDGTGWGGAIPETNFSESWADSSVFRNALDTLESVLTELSDRGIRAYLVQMPVSPHFVSNGIWSEYGPESFALGQYWQSELEARVQKHANARLFNFYKGGQHDFADSEAFDFQHLNNIGAMRLSGMLNDSINADLTQQP